MSNTITSGLVETPVNGGPIGSGTAETKGPEVPPGSGEADSQGSQTGIPEEKVTSGPEGLSEDGASSSEPRRSRSQLSTIHELRQDRRELRQRLEQMQALLESLQARKEPSSSTDSEPDDAGFWNSPLKTIRGEISNMEKRLMQQIQSTRQRESEESALQHETSEAVKFVRSQKGWTPEDEQELIEIIHEKGLVQLPPMVRAEAALAILQQSRGITNKGPMKARASTVIGMPGKSGQKQWSREEVEGLLDRAMSDPSVLTKELEQEILKAEKEGRIK